MIRFHRARDKGFSLIEVLIAVVVLATGLIALAALQGSLSRNSGEAKSRTRVAAMLTARMDELRAGTYAGVGLSDRLRTSVSCASGNPAWLCSARTDAGLGALTVFETVRTFKKPANTTGAFTLVPVPAGASAPADTDAQFKRVTLEAEWQDATGGRSHSLAMTSDFSALALQDSLLPTPSTTSSAFFAPIVRQANPVEAGMIPIAIGNGSETAATNPVPEIVGAGNTIAETKFNVLTYRDEGSSIVQVQQRVETRMVACKCQIGAASNPAAVLEKAYRPSFWNGDRYTSPEATNATALGRATTDVQSDVCVQCCRDHHDPASLEAGKAKFDPVRVNAGASHQHFRVTNYTAPVTANNGTYDEACRVIRVDGLWRTAQDAYAVQSAYVATGPAVTTKTPDPLYADLYEEFVVDYLVDRFVGPSGGQTIQQQYVAHNLDEPGNIDVKASGFSADSRYLHARGLYVDYIEPDALQKINDAKQCINASKASCVLPHVPFTTINLTQLANFSASNTNVLVVANQVSDRGTVNGKPGALNGSTANSVLSVRESNTGLTGSLAIDDADLNGATVDGDRTLLAEDNQKFTVVGTLPTLGSSFSVNLDLASPRMDDGVQVNNPELKWVIGGAGLGCRPTADAVSPNPYTCSTNSVLNIPVDVQVTKYNYPSEDSPPPFTCPNAAQDGTTVLTVSASPTPRPVCKRFGLTGGTVFANADKYGEVSQITLPLVLPGSTQTLSFTAKSDLVGTVQQCNYLRDSEGTFYVASVTWTDPCN